MSWARLRLYAPFLVFVLVQGLVIALAPSKPARTAAAAIDPTTGQPFTSLPPGGVPGFPGAQPTDAAGNPLPPGSLPGGSGPIAPGPGGTTGPVAPGATGGPVRAGDTSHCTRDGRQFGVVYGAPPCVAKWPAGQDNGGRTAQGVTRDEIKVVFIREEKNPVVEALINREGLSRTVEQEQAFLAAAQDFLNKRYELYGRKLKIVYHQANCPESPPDVPACRVALREIVRMQPFAVIWPVPIYPELFDDFYRAGIVSIGGWHAADPYFSGRRPYRWDVFMDGTKTADFIAEYYCQKLAGKPASHSGVVIHPEIGNRGVVRRKLGVIVQENVANVASAKRLASRVKACGGGDSVIVTYASNIERAQTQSSANVTALIDAGVTTVICFGEPIAPIFRTNTMTEQNYYPEHLLAGQGLLDYDKLGRLFNPQQWVHAFGLSHLSRANQIPPSRADANRIWKDTGRAGDACEACGIPASSAILLGQMLQQSGPVLTAENVERGMFAMGRRGGWSSTQRADVQLTLFGPGDYTTVSDVREVYWNASARSGLDGRPGTYLAVEGGRRYERGQFDGQMRVPAAPQ